MLEDKPRAAAMAQNAHRNLCAAFTWDAVSQKVLALLAYIIALFCAKSWIGYGLLLLLLLTAIRVSQIPGKAIVRGMKPLAMILVFTGILNLFFNREGKILFQVLGIVITSGGVQRAAFTVSCISWIRMRKCTMRKPAQQ